MPSAFVYCYVAQILTVETRGLSLKISMTFRAVQVIQFDQYRNSVHFAWLSLEQVVVLKRLNRQAWLSMSNNPATTAQNISMAHLSLGVS
jgi:hypothetical protein